MKKDAWGGAAMAMLPVMIFTLFANEVGKINDTAFWWAFMFEIILLVICTYKAKAFIWQIEDKN